MTKQEEAKKEATLVTKIEKNETELFRFKAKAYRFDVEWKERGDGDLVVAKSEKQYRVILHRDHTGKCAVNFVVAEDINISNLNNNPKAITVSCLDCSDEQPKPTIFAFKFKDEAKANEFKKLLEDNKVGKAVQEKVEEKKEDKAVEEK